MLARMEHVKKAHPRGVEAALRRLPNGQSLDVGAGAVRFRRELLAWYDASKREMPWRRTSDPYAILVSEVMLQQTQVTRVEEYWTRFLERFPTVEALAAAGEDDVCSAWSGLGYYRRARNLRAAASVIVGGGGGVPRTAGLLMELPGIGAYTAAAVASIAFGEAVAVLDANVVRVLARLLAESEDVTRAPARRRLAATATAILDPGRPGDFNQAMMELGAVVCSPTSPACGRCPVGGHCLARAAGDPEAFPIARAATRTNRMYETAAIVIRRGRVLLTSEPDERGWWPGLWRLPRVVFAPVTVDGAPDVDDASDRESREGALRSLLDGEFGLTCDELTHLATTTYGVTTNRVTLDVMSCLSPRGRLVRSSDVSWFALEQALSLGIPAADRRILDRYGPAPLG